jgi:hypothetical protein
VREKGFTPELRKQLLRLRDDVIKYHVIFTDVSGNNIVVARGKRGRERLVIIDGLGDRLWLPVNVLSARVNRLNCIRHFDRAIAKLERIDRERRARSKSRARPAKSR